MKWNQLFSPVQVITEEQAKSFMDSHPTEAYQLLDVRTPQEYQQQHLPGATLVPLNELMAGSGTLDSSKPTIVYCQSGGRSRAASQWLSENGFKEVYDISSNIMSWLGIKLQGAYEYDLNLIKTDADFEDAFVLSYAMEEGLQRFYNQLEENASEESHKKVYQKLAGFEDLHKAELLKRSGRESQPDIEALLATQGEVVEGGSANQLSPFEVVKSMKDIKDIFSLSLAIEAQSFDLYVRLANQAKDGETKALFLEMADEEKQHMEYISGELVKTFQPAA